ncbi:MAG: DUF4238 domain-containing protein [Acidobacteria bacterium]|nr:DUF4238 domain-containing protein [Acidobacteriota bacterium]
MPGDPKQHHYLPQFYLKGFCRDGKHFWVFDCKREKLRPRTTPFNTAKQSHYYSFTDPDGYRSTAIETYLSRLESAAGPHLETLRRRGPLSPAALSELALFLAFLHTRGPSFERFTQQLYDSTTKAFMQLISRQPGAIERMLAETGDDVTLAPEIRRSFENKEGQYEIGSRERLFLMLELGLGDLPKVLDASGWCVLHAPADAAFVTSDRPFTEIPPPATPGKPRPALLSPEGMKFIPLALDMALTIHGEPRLAHVDARPDEVSKFNRLIALQAEELIIGPDEGLVGDLARTSRRTQTLA